MLRLLTAAFGRLCCKSRKLQGSKFFAKTQSGRQSLICITSFALAKSPMSLTQGDEVPHELIPRPLSGSIPELPHIAKVTATNL